MSKKTLREAIAFAYEAIDSKKEIGIAMGVVMLENILKMPDDTKMSDSIDLDL